MRLPWQQQVPSTDLIILFASLVSWALSGGHYAITSQDESVYLRLADAQALCRDFERNFTKLLVGFLSSWTAPRGYRGRALVQKAFEAYFVKEGQKKGSRLVQERYEVAVPNQLSLRDTAKLEASMAIGILGTTAPASFWMASYPISTLLSPIFHFFLGLSLHLQCLHLPYEPPVPAS